MGQRIAASLRTRRYLERELDKLSIQQVVDSTRLKLLDERVAALEAMKSGPFR